MIKKHSISIKLALIYLYAFILIYLPDFSYYIKVNGLIIYSILTVFFLTFKMHLKEKKFIDTFNKKPIAIFIILNIFFTVYYVIRTLIAGTEINDLKNLRIIQNLTPILLLVGVLIVNDELDKLNYTKEKKYKFIIGLGIIQSLSAISMIFIPALRNVAYNIFYKGSTEINRYISESRIYGICDGNYTYSLQVLTSFIALFSFCFAYFYKEKKYYFYSFVILVTTLLNGRTGLLIFMIGIAYLLIREMIYSKKFFSNLKIIFLIAIAIAVICSFVIIFLPNTVRLMNHAVNDIYSFVTEDDYNTETGYLVDMIKVPDSFTDKIFGAGYRIYGRAGIDYGCTLASDIGFINDIFMAGIFSVALLYNSFLFLIFNIKNVNYNSKFEKVTSIIILIAMILSNVKGEFFRSQMQISTVLIILIFMLMEEKKNEKIISNNTSV